MSLSLHWYLFYGIPYKPKCCLARLQHRDTALFDQSNTRVGSSPYRDLFSCSCLSVNVSYQLKTTFTLASYFQRKEIEDSRKMYQLKTECWIQLQKCNDLLLYRRFLKKNFLATTLIKAMFWFIVLHRILHVDISHLSRSSVIHRIMRFKYIPHTNCFSVLLVTQIIYSGLLALHSQPDLQYM